VLRTATSLTGSSTRDIAQAREGGIPRGAPAGVTQASHQKRASRRTAHRLVCASDGGGRPVVEAVLGDAVPGRAGGAVVERCAAGCSRSSCARPSCRMTERSASAEVSSASAAAGGAPRRVGMRVRRRAVVDLGVWSGEVMRFDDALVALRQHARALGTEDPCSVSATTLTSGLHPARLGRSALSCV
jgi:hypothetical protein